MIVLYWLLCIIIGFIPAYFVYQRDKKNNSRYKIIPSILRGFSFFLVAALLLAPAFRWTTNKKQKPKIIWLQDNSSSINNALGANKSSFLNKRNEVINKLDDYDVISYGFGNTTIIQNQYAFDKTSTNIEQAIQHIVHKYKGANLGAVIIPSDGIINEGINPSLVSQNLQTPIITIGIGDSSEVKDISVLRTFANKVVLSGTVFEVAADVKFSKFSGSNHNIIISSNGKTIQSKNVHIQDEIQTISTSFEIKASNPGIYKYSVMIAPADGEKTTLNNTLSFYVQVVDNKSKLLMLNGGAHPDIGFISNALKQAEGYSVTIAAPNTIPDDLSNYKTIIAHQPSLSAAQWNKISSSQIPIWHILGLQSTATQITASQSLLTASLGGANYYSPIANSSFSIFKLPLSAASVLAKLPPLESNVVKANAKEKSNVMLKTKESVSDLWLVQNTQIPLAITIGEGLWRWGIYEYKTNKNNAVTHELIQQTLRVLNIPKVDKPFQVALSKRFLTDNDNVNFSAELRNKSGQQINDAEARLVIKDENGATNNFIFEKFGEGYQLTIPKLASGSYNYVGSVNYKGINYSDQGSFAVESIPLESLNTQADFGLLYLMSYTTGGQFYTLDNMQNLTDFIKKNETIKSKIITKTNQEPLIEYKWIFGLLLLLLSLEWIIRKYLSMH